MRYLLGIDNGGTFSKAALFDEDGRQIASASRKTEVITPKPGYTERNMNDLWEANQKCIYEVINKSNIDPKEIAGVSFSGHGKGLYMVGYDGKPSYNGILSTDCRAWEYVKKWNEDGTSKKVFEKTIQDIVACQPVSILAWFKDNMPKVIENTKWIFSVKDYIRFMLTNEAYGEYTDFSGSNLINMNTCEYDDELLGYFGLSDIKEKLPPLKYSSENCGYITKTASEKTGLIEGTPVAGGMFDIDACGVASGLCDEKQLCMIAGTWSINEYISKSPIRDKSIAHNSIYCMKGYYLIEESSPTSAGNLEWFIKNLMSYEKDDLNSSIYELTNEMVSEINPKNSNVIFLPFLNGSGDDALAKGTFIGLTEYHGKAHMLLSVYEGVVFTHKAHIDKLLRNREKPDTIRLSGGAAKSEVWVQMFADVLQIPIDVIEDKELGAQGAAICAGIAANVYDSFDMAAKKTVRISKTVHPRVKYKEIYYRKYEIYKKAVESLKDTWKCFEN